MAPRPLAGRTVVTTRDARGDLDALLAAHGADVLHVPLIEIRDVDEAVATSKTAPDGGVATSGVVMRDALTRLDEFDWLIVTSHHGASRVGSAAAASRVRLGAVGSRTARVLSELAGRGVDVVPDRQTAADLVAAMPEPGSAPRVLVAQADRADDTLTAGLTARGYSATAVTAYRTVLRVPTSADRLAALRADAVVFASGSAARAWADAIGTETPPVVVSIGPTTSRAAAQAGITVTHEASDHDLAGVVRQTAVALSPSS